MQTQEYFIAWGAYLIAAVALSFISWKVFRRFLLRELAYLGQGWWMAILFTPWYVLPDRDVMAPAFIIFLMDTITLDAAAGIRALIPLVMAMLLALLITVVLSLIYRIGRRKRASAASTS